MRTITQVRSIKRKHNIACRDAKRARMKRRWRRQYNNAKLQLNRLKRDHSMAYDSAYESWSTTASEFWEGHEWVIENFISDMDNVGIYIDAEDVHFTGFWSQGDGACFKASIPVDEKFVAGHALDAEWEYALTAAMCAEDILNPIEVRTSDNRYSHQYTMYADEDDFFDSLDPDIWDQDDDIIDSGIYRGMRTEDACELLQKGKVLDDLVENVLDTCRDHASDLYKSLEEDYNFATSHECFDSYLREYGFKYDKETQEVVMQ